MVKTFTLYPDQAAIVNRVRYSMRTHKAVLMQSVTGSGKTLMAVYMMQSAIAKGKRAMFVVPRRALLAQTAKDLSKYGIEYGVIASGNAPNPFAKIQLATSGSLVNRLDRVTVPDLVFFDETHYGATQLGKIIDFYRAQGSYVIGLSATPWKTNGQGLDVWYDDMVEGPQIKWMIENKRLSRFRLFAPDVPDLSGLSSERQIDEKMRADKVLIGNAARHYKSHAMGKINIAFCTSIAHAEITAGIFKDNGIPAAHISSKMDDIEIQRRVKALARREILTLTSCDLMSFGFDLSSAAGMDVTVESMSDLRPTDSLALQMQKWGRVLRMKSEPAMIFDHAGNTGQDKHGMPDSDRVWSLEGRVKDKRKSSEKTEPIRQCGECHFVHRPSPECPECGHVYPILSRTIEEIDGELIEIEERAAMVERKKIQGMAKGLAELTKVGMGRGMNRYKAAAWAGHVIKAREAKKRG